jgi:hypothetical protein
MTGGSVAGSAVLTLIAAMRTLGGAPEATRTRYSPVVSSRSPVSRWHGRPLDKTAQHISH